jgi:hypothetical protein
MTMTPFRGRCHTCGHDHDAEDVRLRDLMGICDEARQRKVAAQFEPELTALRERCDYMLAACRDAQGLAAAYQEALLRINFGGHLSAEQLRGIAHAAVMTGALNVQRAAEMLVQAAAAQGEVLTIDQEPLQPLAMGHYRTVVSVRKARGAA